MPFNSDHILSLLPGKPGVYQFLDGNGRIIYAGKAINLKKRVASYFSGKQSGKTALMLKRAEDLKHIVVASESDALLLENNIIKTHQPRYNILLKDDKTYPWICIKNEPFPRVFSTRNHIKDGSLYFGPYTSGLMVKTMVNHLREIFKLRTCSHHLTRKNIEDNKFKVCLEYHLGNCRAPCVSLQSEEDYEDNLMQVRDILRGHISVVINNLKERMTALAGQLRFEEALLVKEKMEILSKYKSRSAVVSASVGNVDVFAFEQEGESTYINYLKVIEGAVIQAFNLEMKSRLEDEKDALLGFAITEIRQKLDSDSKEIIVPFFPDIKLENVKYQIPSRGEKMKLLELAQHNAVFYRLEQKKRRGDF